MPHAQYPQDTIAQRLLGGALLAGATVVTMAVAAVQHPPQLLSWSVALVPAGAFIAGLLIPPDPDPTR